MIRVSNQYQTAIWDIILPTTITMAPPYCSIQHHSPESAFVHGFPLPYMGRNWNPEHPRTHVAPLSTPLNMLRLATWNSFASLLSPFITFYYHLHVFNYNLEKKRILLNQSAIECTPPYDYYPFGFRTPTPLCAVSCCGAQFVGSSPMKRSKAEPQHDWHLSHYCLHQAHHF